MIEDKLQKDREKQVRQWPEAEVRIEKGRWGNLVLIKGRTRVNLPKDTDPESMTLEQAQELLSKRKPKKKS